MRRHKVARIDGVWALEARGVRGEGWSRAVAFVVTSWGVIGVAHIDGPIEIPGHFTLIAVKGGREYHRFVSRLGKRFTWRAVVREANWFGKHVASGKTSRRTR